MTLYIPDEQKYLDMLTEIVVENISNSNFSVTELARQMGLSHSTLHRRLKAIAKQSISQFIRETRLNRGMELLRLQAGTVAEVAYGVGFGSTTYFSKCFHDHFGYPPGEVRKRFVAERDSVETESVQKEPESHVRSIAVLPFENYTGAEKQDYLAFGMHDTLISELGQLGSIRVVSRTSSLSFSGSNKTIKEIASELCVDAIIEASVLSARENIRVQLRLIKAFPEEQQLWSQTYDVDLGDLLNLYSKIIKEIAIEIDVSLTPTQISQLDRSREVHPGCYKAYLLGIYHLNLLTPEGKEKGMKYLHEAIRIDPSEPLGYAGLALGYLEIGHGFFDKGDSYKNAEEAVLRALELDTTMPEIYAVQAELCMYSSWEFEKSVNHFKRAIELNPNLNHARYHFSTILLLLGHNEEAVNELELARKGDPLNPLYTSMLGFIYYLVGRNEDGLRETYASLELQKDYIFAYMNLGEIYLSMGREKDAIEAHEKLVEVAPWFNWLLGNTYAVTNHIEKAETILEELEKTEVVNWTAMGRSALYGALGRMDEAFEWLNHELHHAWIPWFTKLPWGKPHRNDIRFKEFVKKLNLPKA